MLYFSRFRSSDPFLAFTHGKRSYGLAVPMEFSRMMDESAFDEVLLLSEIREGAAKRFKLPKGTAPDDSHVVLHLAKEYGIREFHGGLPLPGRAGVQAQGRRTGHSSGGKRQPAAPAPVQDRR